MKKLSYLFLIVLFCVSCRININKNNKPAKFTISYVTEYGVCPETFTVNENTILSSDQLQELNEYGYVFRGWFLDEVKIEPDAYIVKDNITLKAKWDYGYFISVEEFYNIAPELNEFNEINKGKETVYIYITDEDPDMEKIRQALILASGKNREHFPYIYLDLSKCLKLEVINEGIFTCPQLNKEDFHERFLKSQQKLRELIDSGREDLLNDYRLANLYSWEFFYYHNIVAAGDFDSLYALILPDSVKKIGNRAFWGLFWIRELYLPPSITEFGEEVFVYNFNDAKIVLPENMEEIPRGTFAAYGLSVCCEELLEWPQNLKSIGPYAFCNSCSYRVNGNKPFNNSEMKIPEGVSTIKEYAFATNCFERIYLPNSLSYIGDFAFAHSMDIEEINLPSNISYIGNGAFHSNPNLKKVTFSSGINSLHIESDAFADCESLECFDFSELLKDGEEWSYEVFNFVDDRRYSGAEFSGVITNDLLKPYEYNFLDFIWCELQRLYGLPVFSIESARRQAACYSTISLTKR